MLADKAALIPVPRVAATHGTGAVMQIVIMGCGYVGLVTGACLAEMGNQVSCIDSDPRKLTQLRIRKVPLF